MTKKRLTCKQCMDCKCWHIATDSCPYCLLTKLRKNIKVCEEDVRASNEREIELERELEKLKGHYDEQAKRENMLEAKIEAYKIAITLISGHRER